MKKLLIVGVTLMLLLTSCKSKEEYATYAYIKDPFGSVDKVGVKSYIIAYSEVRIKDWNGKVYITDLENVLIVKEKQ